VQLPQHHRLVVRKQARREAANRRVQQHQHK